MKTCICSGCGNEHEIDDEPRANVEKIELDHCGICGTTDHESEQCPLQ